MCGFGVAAGDLNVGHRNMFDWLLYLDAQRGWDSTGLATVDPKAGEVKIFKSAVPAADFMADERYDKTRNVTDSLWLGHNRAATVGKITDDNAHPFEFGDIVGAHNGTLNPTWRSDLGVQGMDGMNIDSQGLIHCINENGIEDTVAAARGAFAIVYYDKRDHTLNWIRNERRPLLFGFTKNAKSAWIVSDPTYFMMARRTAKMTDACELANEKDLLTDCKPGTLYTMDLPDRSGWKLKEGMFRRKDLSFKHRTLVQGGTGPSQRTFPARAIGYSGPRQVISPPKNEAPPIEKPTPQTPQEEAASSYSGTAAVAAGKNKVQVTQDDIKAGQAILERWDQIQSTRFKGDSSYEQFLAHHAHYVLWDPEDTPEYQEFDEWRRCMVDLETTANEAAKQAHADVFNKGLSAATASAVVRSEYKLMYARDILQMSYHTLWKSDEYRFQNGLPSLTTDGDVSPIDGKPPGDTSTEEMKAKMDEALKSEPPASIARMEQNTAVHDRALMIADKMTLPKTSGPELKRPLDKKLLPLLTTMKCQLCLKPEQSPSGYGTVVTKDSKGEPKGLVCSTCTSDPNILRWATSERCQNG